MDQVVCNNLVQAIKSDDLILFSANINGNENLSFGRFPLLTLCYLFNSKKIIRKYNKQLGKIDKFIECEEDFEIYKEFRKFAGRCLRLYQNKEYIISPLEMLAILHKDSILKRKIKTFYKSEQTINNLKKIYDIHGQSFEMYTMSVNLTLLPYTKTQRKRKILSIVSSISIALILSVVYIIMGFTTGVGTDWSYYKISSLSQLQLALKSNGSYVLNKDIIIDDFDNNIIFNGNIDGNNHTIYINQNDSNYFIKENIGTIKNLNIVYSEIDNEILESYSLFVSNNKGELNNIKILCEKLNLICDRSNKDIYINGIANVNEGTIKGSSVLLNATIKSLPRNNCFVSGLIGINKSKVESCSLSAGSQIETYEADLSGIITTNEIDCIVTNLYNYGTLIQNSSTSDKPQNISGIVQTNFGRIDKSINKGSLKLVSTYSEEDIESDSTIIAGGITAVNYSIINNCLNDASIDVTSHRMIVYCGGVSGFASRGQDLPNYSEINGCGANGTLKVESIHDKGYVFAGGLGGRYLGTINNCYSLMKYDNIPTKEKYFLGLSCGATNVEYVYWGGILINTIIYLNASNTFVSYQDNIPNHMGSLINMSGVIVPSSIDDSTGGIITSTEEKIKQQGVYWYE